MFSRVRAISVAAAVGTAMTIALSASAGAANAAVAPHDVLGCSGSACMELGDPSSGFVKILAFSQDAFFGHFQLLWPLGSANSGGDKQWSAYEAVGFITPAVVGAYCVIAWEKSATGYTNIGEPCENVE